MKKPSDPWRKAPLWLLLAQAEELTGLSRETLLRLGVQGQIRLAVYKEDVLECLAKKAKELREREAALPEWLSADQAAELTGFSRAHIDFLVANDDVDLNLEGQIETNSLIEWIEVIVELYSGVWD